MATTSTGAFVQFDPKIHLWTLYSERLEQYFAANLIETQATMNLEEKSAVLKRKRAILLTVCGDETYSLIRSLISPALPKDKTYEELVNTLNKHFNPAPNEVVERLKFYARSRLPNESVSTFVSELRRMAEFCKFTELDNMIRDRIVGGIADKSMQDRLIDKGSNLTLQDAISLIQTMESTRSNTNALDAANNRPDGKDSINKMSILKKNTRSKTKYRSTDNIKSSSHQCYRCCSTDHDPSKCPFKSAKCYSCQRTGHIGKACRNGSTRPTKSYENSKPKHISRANMIMETPESMHLEYELHHVKVQAVRTNKESINKLNHIMPPPEPYMMNFTINDHPVRLEIDTGSAYTIISKKTYQRIAPLIPLQPTSVGLYSWSGHSVPIEGEIELKVKHKDKTLMLPLMVVSDESRPDLCGRTWIFSQLNIVERKTGGLVNAIQDQPEYLMQLEKILEKHETLFDDETGCLKDVKVHLYVKPNAIPRFFKPHSIPYALKEKVEKELSRLEKAKIISPIPFSEYAAPIVPVLKNNNSIRICGDFKITANKVINTEKYPLPRAEDIFASMAGCTIFSRLDMKDAYNQLMLDDESKKIVAINTPKGLYTYNRLPFGISSASAIFQRYMETLLGQEKGVYPYQDDILLGGTSISDHLTKLDRVLTIFRKAGLKLRREKCLFTQTSIDFLGFRLDAKGLHPKEDKITAIMDAPEPTSVDELRSFLGLFNYYARFIPDASTTLAPLHELLTKHQRWEWTDRHTTALRKAKDTLRKSKLLVHYDSKKEVMISCDASPVGLGTVLSHVSDGKESPIAFASRSLSTAERNYSQIEREALAIVYGVTHFRDYLMGRHFYIITDHQPLLSLFSENKPVPALAASRIQRWALMLSGYDYTIKYKKGILHGNADALSRLPLQTKDFEPPTPAEHVLLIEAIDSGPINTQALREETENDSTLSAAIRYLKHGWTSNTIDDEELTILSKRRDELSIVKGILLMGNRVVIPKRYRPWMLQELHESHQGIVHMKSVARSKIWWPKIDLHIQETAQSCTSCIEHASLPRRHFSPWQHPETPWTRVHVDYAGPIENKYLFIIVDAYSKWMEIEITTNITSATTINILRQNIARYGIMPTLVSDNGPCFTSMEFKEFTNQNGINHLTIAPYHPESNGQAERSVRTVKTSLKKITAGLIGEIKIIEDGLNQGHKGTLQSRLQRFLLNYRKTPKVDGKSPAQLMFGRDIMTRLDIFHPKKSFQNETGVKYTNKFSSGMHVTVRNFGSGPKWIQGTICQSMGNMMYTISTEKGNIRRHQNQIRNAPNPENTKYQQKHDEQSTSGRTSNPQPAIALNFQHSKQTNEENRTVRDKGSTMQPTANAETSTIRTSPEKQKAIATEVNADIILDDHDQPRKSSRQKKQPDRLQYYGIE